MSFISQGIRSRIINSPDTLVPLLDHIATLPGRSPWLFLCLKGLRLESRGFVSVMTLYTDSQDTIYLVDLQEIGTSIFTIANESGITLKSILETAAISKIIFDERKVSHALISHYKIFIIGVKDVQLMELDARSGPGNCVDLAECISKDLPAAVKQEWESTKRDIAQLVDIEEGGQSDLINERPLRRKVVQYCTQEIRLVSRLYHVYNQRLRSLSRAQTSVATSYPIKLPKANHEGSWDQSENRQSNNVAVDVESEDEWIEDKRNESTNEDTIFNFDD